MSATLRSASRASNAVLWLDIKFTDGTPGTMAAVIIPFVGKTAE